MLVTCAACGREIVGKSLTVWLDAETADWLGARYPDAVPRCGAQTAVVHRNTRYCSDLYLRRKLLAM